MFSRLLFGMSKGHWDIIRDMPDMTGKVVLITGANAGIGKEMSRHLALHNAKVYIATRSESKSLAAIEDLRKAHPELADKPAISYLPLDLANFKSCISAAQTFMEKEERLDVLINSAGIMATPFELCHDGFESQIQINYLGHFLLTMELLPILIKTSKDPKSSVRILQLSSEVYKYSDPSITFSSVEEINGEKTGPYTRYANAKLATILFAKELHRRLSKERIFNASLHPGVTDSALTDGFKNGYPSLFIRIPYNVVLWLMKTTPYNAAITPLYVATSTEVVQKNWSGEYFKDYAKRVEPTKQAQDPTLARNLWDLSMKIVKDKTGKTYPDF